MNTLVTLLLRHLDRRKPELTLKWTEGYTAYPEYIAFGVALTNDGTKIARDVVVRGYLDGEQVFEGKPIDVPAEADPIQKMIDLARPGMADLEKRLNDRPVFHGRKFTATATIGHRMRRIAWPHEEEPEPWTYAQQARSELLARAEQQRDDPDNSDRYEHI